MNNLIKLALVSVMLFGCDSSSNLDNYKIQWSGTNGNKLFGSYVITSKIPNTPSKVEKIVSNLPYEITFSAPKNSLVSAAGATINKNSIEIKIFKNGLECGKAAFVGGMANKVCQ